MLLTFNKIDISRHEFALEWMAEFDTFAAALESDSSYAATLSRSLSLVLEEFYRDMNSVGVSALTGEGMDDLFKGLSKCAAEYHQFYVPELQAKARRKEEVEQKRRAKEMERLRQDMAKAAIGGGAAAGPAADSSSGVAAADASTDHEDEVESIDLQLSDDSIEDAIGATGQDD
eukprot:gene4693-4945_t